jgi:hypothetical protein
LNVSQRHYERDFIRAVARSPQNSNLLQLVSPESLGCVEHTLIWRAMQHCFETKGRFDLDAIRAWFRQYAAEDSKALEEMLIEILSDEA